MDKKFQWVTFYEAFADKMFEYKDKRNELYTIIKDLSLDEPFMDFLHFEKDRWWQPRNYEIDPFSVMAIFNRSITDENRISLIKKLASAFAIDTPAPSEFHGIPVLNNQRSTFGYSEPKGTLFRASKPSVPRVESQPFRGSRAIDSDEWEPRIPSKRCM